MFSHWSQMVCIFIYYIFLHFIDPSSSKVNFGQLNGHLLCLILCQKLLSSKRPKLSKSALSCIVNLLLLSHIVCSGIHQLSLSFFSLTITPLTSARGRVLTCLWLLGYRLNLSTEVTPMPRGTIRHSLERTRFISIRHALFIHTGLELLQVADLEIQTLGIDYALC